VASGLLASAASVLINRTDVGVGASGAAMGLVGALGVLALRRPQLFAEGDRRRWIATLNLVVVATLAVGLVESEAIDNAAHAAGLLAGAVIGWLLLPGVLETGTHRATRRLFALALCGLLFDCAAGAAVRISSWRGERVVREGGVEVALPAWLRTRAAGTSGTIARRAPLGFAVQFGRDPQAPDVAALLGDDAPVGPGWTEVERPAPAELAGDPACEVRDFVENDGSGLRLKTYRSGPAFALVAMRVGPGGEREDDDLALRVGLSLRAVD
jgi:hypothetical protein